MVSHPEIIPFSLEEWESLDSRLFGDDYDTGSEEAEIDWQEIISALDLDDDSDALYESLSLFPDGIRERILENDFSEEQLEQARLGFESGLSEQEVLRYFDSSNPPERMELIRKILAR